MAIDFDLIKEIKSRADIVDVISSYLPSVQKKGRNFVAICPFHDDHDPSMQINKEKQIFNCFVCHSSGDVFSFVQKYDKCTFEEAVRKVCEIINFDDPRLHKKSYVRPVDQNLVPIYNCINELQKLYVYGLTTDEGKVARDYLDNRKINEEQRAKFSLGYAINDGKMTIEYLKQKGFSLKNIEDTGIALAQTSGMADHNSGRLIFPIKDQNGQVVGFSARRLNDNNDEAKYVNSPETKIFTKGNILYNYNLAKQTAKHDGFIYVVEGFMDVFAFDTIGITSVVALMSTKLTKQHIELLRRLGVEIRLCLDGDKPGQEAMMKLMSQLDEANLPYRLVSVPGEIRDPDEILKQDGEEKLKSFVTTLVDPFNFAINYYQNISHLGSVDDRKKVVAHFAPTISNMKSKLEQDDYIFKLSEVTGFSSGAIKEYIRDYAKSSKGSSEDSGRSFEEYRKEIDNEIPKEMRRLANAEKLMLGQMIVSKEAVDYFNQNIKYFIIEDYRILSNFINEFVSANGDIDPSLLVSFISESEVPNKDEIVSLLTTFSFEKDKVFNPQIIRDCKSAIVEERDRISSRSQLRQALEGKTPRDKARLAGDYIAYTNKNKNKAK